MKDSVIFAADFVKTMKRRYCVFLFSVLFSAVLPVAKAENGMNSPYTRFGFGQLAVPELGIHKAMGGTGIAVRNYNQINLLNPASYSTVDTLTFILDMGLSLQNTNFSEGSVRKNARNASFDYLAAQFRLVRGWGMTVAYLPLSNIGYSYSNTSTVRTDEEGIVTSTNAYSGEGGLHQVRTGIGWEPFRWLSIGANANYTYGYMQHVVANSYSESTISSRTKVYSADVSAFGFDAGLQFCFDTKTDRFVLGATYTPALKLNGRPYVVDYVVTSSVATSADTLFHSPLTMPETIGAGLSWKHGDHFLIAADASLKRFGSTQFFGESGLDQWRASIGCQYTPTYNRHNFLRCMLYRAGVHYATTYYKVNGVAGPAELGVSAGVGIPILNRWNQRSAVNLSGQFIHMQPAAAGMMAENYFRLNLSVSFIENWFTKWRVN